LKVENKSKATFLDIDEEVRALNDSLIAINEEDTSNITASDFNLLARNMYSKDEVLIGLYKNLKGNDDSIEQKKFTSKDE